MNFYFRGKKKKKIRQPLLSPSAHGNPDIIELARFRAGMDSAAYYEEHMLTARAFESDLALLAHAIDIAPRDGLVLEMGVATGRTINHIASLIGERRIYGFDSFEGLPEDWWTKFPKGAFAMDALPRVATNAILIKGMFSDSLPNFLADHRELVSLLHIDCDLYSSCKTVLDELGERLRPGSVIVFDEYLNYPGWRRHEFKAFREFITSRNLSYTYSAFVPSHEQVCVILS